MTAKEVQKTRDPRFQQSPPVPSDEYPKGVPYPGQAAYTCPSCVIPGPAGTARSGGSIIRGPKGKAHLALSEIGEAPVTADEPCPLGLRWTRVCFHRACNDRRSRGRGTTEETFQSGAKQEQIEEAEGRAGKAANYAEMEPEV